MPYHVDSFYAAVSVLVGHGHIKQRLMKAYGEYLDSIIEDELPEIVRETFVELQRSLHRVAPLNGEGAVCASVRKMSAEEAGECAASIVAMYRSMIRSANSNEPDVSLDHDNRKALPPFLVKSV